MNTVNEEAIRIARLFEDAKITIRDRDERIAELERALRWIREHGDYANASMIVDVAALALLSKSE